MPIIHYILVTAIKNILKFTSGENLKTGAIQKGVKFCEPLPTVFNFLKPECLFIFIFIFIFFYLIKLNCFF